MKIPIETKEEKDQRKEEEAWREQLDHNAKIMKACMAAIPDRPECVWVALFKSIVPSASQGDIGKLLNVGFGLLENADKSIKSRDNRIMFDDLEPPEPPPPVVTPAFITVGTTATLLYENRSGKMRHLTVLNCSNVLPMKIVIQGAEFDASNIWTIIPPSECQDTVLSPGRFLWGIADDGPVTARTRLIYNLEQQVCCLCGSKDLLQTVFLSNPSGDSYYIPSTGQNVSLDETYICMKCLRKLIEKERRNAG